MFILFTGATLGSSFSSNFTTALQIGLPLMIVGMSVVLVALTIIGELMRWTGILCDKWMPAAAEQDQEDAGATASIQSSASTQTQAPATIEPKTSNVTLAVIAAATAYMVRQNLHIKRIIRIPTPKVSTGTRWATMGRLMHQDSHNLRR